jgi:hypothetical protein
MTSSEKRPMIGELRLLGDSGSAFCPHAFGRGSRVAGSRALRSREIFERTYARVFAEFTSPVLLPQGGIFSIASFVGHGHGPLVGRLRALAFFSPPPNEPSPCTVGALQEAKHPCTSTNVIQRTCAD